ncbi:histidine kinase [Frateuria sp. Soil773]|uniref:ATP-binding protein n=1 Tax=Frateuria sp. Soil773 TaxID=1736407 RepID=UPI0006FF330B|nr:ATP-binding protein [Frateuria sp. Soil773]KRE99478.1 histidine kinase [Frateuria sp. Soil773]
MPITPALAWIDVALAPTAIAVYCLAALLAVSAGLALALLWRVHVERTRLARGRRQLAQQQAYAQALLDSLPFPVTVKDRDGAYLMLNAASRRDIRIDADAIGRTSLALPDHGPFEIEGAQPTRQRLHQSSLAVVEAGQGRQCEIAYTGGDGSHRAGLWWDCPVRVDDRGVVGSLGVLLDVTRFQQREQAARAAEQSLLEIAHHVPVLVFTVSLDAGGRRRLLFLAGDLRALFGLAPQDLVEAGDALRDWPFGDRIHPEDKSRVRRLLIRARRDASVHTLDFRAYGEEGLRWLHLVMAPRALPDGSVHWSGYFIDTTGINAHNEALRAARDAAERASKAKADFLATMSHEIRTPMNGVIGMLELLRHTRLDAEQQELLHAVEDSAGVLLQVLNDVLDFSKLEAGDLRLDDAPFDLRTLVDNVVGMMATHMHKKGLRIQVAVDAALAGQLVGDSVRIRQILLNLLNNAGKFTDSGSVSVGVRVIGDDGGSQRVRLSVADTGIGIAADKQVNLFTPFSQAESWTTRRYGGSGLGLAICRHLIQLMDGSIKLTSEPGAGTTVTVELRLPVERRDVERPPGLAGRHAIVRLAAPAVAAALADHLLALGLTVEQVPPAQPLRSGLAANLLFVDRDDETSPPLVAAQAIAVDADAAALGAPQVEGERIQLGANPLKWRSVARACEMGLAPLSPRPRSFHGPAPAAAEPARGQGRGRILVAEDHPVSQTLVRRQLELLGWPCDVVGDGHEAYEALRQGRYAMLMTDCQMPRMDGYELASSWRRHEAETGSFTRLPIVAMTASALDGEGRRCRDAGMDDYLDKPVQLHQLAEKIAAWMPEQVQPQRPSAGVPPVAADRLFDDPAMQALKADLLRTLRETGHADLLRLGQAIDDDDAQAAAQWLHRLLGALQLFCDDELLAEGRQWLEILQAGGEPDVLRRLPPYLDDLRQLLDRLDQPAASLPAG